MKSSRDILERLLQLLAVDRPTALTREDRDNPSLADWIADVNEVRVLLEDAPPTIARERAMEALTESDFNH